MAISVANKRPRIFHRTAIAALAGVFLLGFCLLFINQAQLRTLLGEDKADSLATMYSRILLRMNPDDADLRMNLARRLAHAGHRPEAREVLKVLLPAEKKDIPAQLLALELDWTDFHALPPEAPGRRAWLDAVIRRIESLAGQPLSLAECSHLADLSGQAGRPEIGARFFAKMAALTTDPIAAEGYAKSALDALRAADRGAEALTLAEHYAQTFPGSAILIGLGMDIAAAQNDTQKAREFGRRMVALRPADRAVLDRQIDLELAAGELGVAMDLAAGSVAAAPDCVPCRERLARIAEWRGQPETALEHWSWLALRQGDPRAVPEALRVAQGLYRDDLTLKLLRMQQGSERLAEDRFAMMQTLYARSGDAGAWIGFLEETIKRQPNDYFLWAALAEARSRNGETESAVAAWKTIGDRFGRKAEAARHIAESLWEQGRAEEALTVLRESSAAAGREEKDFWRLYGELAWSLERSEEAKGVYQTLVQSGAGDELSHERLVHLLRDGGDFAGAADVAERSSRRFGNPRYLLLAMDTALQGKQWQILQDYLRTAEANPDYFAAQESYWLLRAAVAQHQDRIAEAEKFYGAALKVNPGSVSARLGILWLCIDHRVAGTLDRYLQLWEQEAVQSPEFWDAYGAGYVTLKDYRKALPWFHLQKGAHAEDDLWVLSYADVLQQNGQHRPAWRLRRQVLSRLAARMAGNPSKDSAALASAYANLLKETEGAPAHYRLLKASLEKQPHDAVLVGAALSAALADENVEAARFWLLEMQAERQKLPAWQRLTVALAENDKGAIARILAEDGEALSPLDQVQALKRLDRNEEALRVAEAQSNLQSSQSEALEAERFALTREAASLAGIGWEIKQLGSLDIERELAVASFRPIDNNRLSLRFSHNYLDTSDDHFVAPTHVDEYDFNLKWNTLLWETSVNVMAGANFRDGGRDLPYGRVALEKSLYSWLDMGLEIGVNEVTEDTAALRAVGAKDQVAIQFLFHPTRREYARLRLGGQRYRTRDDIRLGEGYNFEGEIGTNLLLGEPLLQIRLQGQIQANSLPNQVPNSLRNSGMLIGTATPQDIVAPEFQMFGLGFRLATGGFGELPGRFSANVDGWLGGLWPSGEFAYRFSGGLGVSPLGSDRLSLEAFYANVQGGLPGQSFQGLQINYRLWF
jgi:tetratricopeptide (TPR) repeat protein